MLLTDGEIRSAMVSGELAIEHFADECLQPASYDMRIGGRALRSGDDAETSLAAAQTLVLNAGQFALLTTHELLTVPADIAGHIGVRSYFTRKGLILLAGLQIDPGFEGALVLGVYNASPRRLSLDYLEPFCTVEFHRLAVAAVAPYRPGPEQLRGAIPVVDKDYLRTIETESLSEVAASVRALTVNVGALTDKVKLSVNLVVATFVAALGAVIATVIAAILT